MKREDGIILLICGVGLVMALIGYNLGLIRSASLQPRLDDRSVIVRTDTVRLHDTIVRPEPVKSLIVRIDTVRTPKDTIYLCVEQKEYVTEVRNDSLEGTIKVKLSGYDAALDSLIYDLRVPERTIITKERKKWSFTVGPQIGAGYDGRGMRPYIGAGLTWGYNF